MKRTLAPVLGLILPAAGYTMDSPPEDLDGPPLVTAKSWAIADGRTGKFLWGENADEPMKAASTTKMMCAQIVLHLAEEDPAVLQETVTFSDLADKTEGSTAGINTGEKLTVLEALYALLLPSGNDAGNAIAEHFNSRVAPPDELSPPELASPVYETRRNFIAEMNRKAASLGLTRTIYRSSFGDGGTVEDRTTTARELLVVAWASLKNPHFRQIVGTRQATARVVGPDGTTREVAWENTNKLLAVAGYDGVKTGQTQSAGSCLVASGHRGPHHLLVAVLGSTSDEGRYVDCRNLFRWAWRQLEKEQAP